MNESSFFDTLENQFAKQLPFVVYSRPINSIIKCWLQNSDTLYETDTFSESGFVFAPFDLDKPAILLPSEHCQHELLEISDLDVKSNETLINITSENKEQHIELVTKGISSIKTGQLDKVVLSHCIERPLEQLNPITIFKRLFNSYKNAMVYCWFHPKVGLWVGATPELLFKVVGQQLTTISLAGTQALSNHQDVSWTTKEIEEQQIVTDYIVDQITPYTNQLQISEVETVRAGNLLHLKSRIKSVINKDADLKSVINALHPTPAVCGFPKNQAKEFILKHEHYQRDFYTGFLGELNLKQSKTRNNNRRNVENNAYAVVKTNSNFYVNLRCAQIKDDKVLIYVGGGITKDSNAQKEWEETINKTKTIVKVLN
jgi:isochorismate synthase